MSDPLADRLRGAARALTGLSASVLGPLANAVSSAAFTSGGSSEPNAWSKQEDSASEAGPAVDNGSSKLIGGTSGNVKSTYIYGGDEKRRDSRRKLQTKSKTDGSKHNSNQPKQNSRRTTSSPSRKLETMDKNKLLNTTRSAGIDVTTGSVRIRPMKGSGAEAVIKNNKGRARKPQRASSGNTWATTSFAYENGVADHLEEVIHVVTPNFRKVVPLRDNGHPDVSKLPDEPVVAKRKGNEDMSDEKFYKRHLSAEVNERKRKKYNSHLTQFDFQQEQRKKRVEEKARQKLMKHLSLPEPEPVKVPAKPFSFWPDISSDHSKTILIADELPVCAFGCQVPKFERRIPFNLPASGINAMMVLTKKEDTSKPVKVAQKPATDGPAASSGRRARREQQRYDPERNGDFQTLRKIKSKSKT